MAKRMSLSERRATDARGVDVIFGGAPVSQEELTSEEEETSENSPSQESAPATPELGTSPGGGAKPALVKATIYIRPEQVFAIESIQLAQRQRTGQKPDKSDLLQEAVDLLIAKYQG